MACHIALEETGAPFEPVPVLRTKRENREPAYLAVHPRGLVPVLEFDDGSV
jgi:glutathione S-transferase